MRLGYPAPPATAPITTVGFLDDLKRQAQERQTQQTLDTATLARHAALADAACKTALQYLLELAKQLNVLQPQPPVRFSLDNRNALNGLVRCDFRVDSRRKQHRHQEVFDHVVIHALQKSGRSLTLTKDFPPEIERLENRLRQAGITPDVEVVRKPDNGTLEHARYTFTADVVLMVKLLPDHDAGRVKFQMLNFDGLESITAEFAAHDVTTGLLDELARWLVGEPHQFLRNAENLRRVEA